MVHPVLQRFNNFILVSISVLMLFHSMSLYAVPVADIEEEVQTEQAQDIDDEQQLLKTYDALIPTFQGMTPLVLYFIQEVVLLSESEYQEIQVPNHYQNHLLEVLFPRIISPNAP